MHESFNFVVYMLCVKLNLWGCRIDEHLIDDFKLALKQTEIETYYYE